MRATPSLVFKPTLVGPGGKRIWMQQKSVQSGDGADDTLDLQKKLCASDSIPALSMELVARDRKRQSSIFKRAEGLEADGIVGPRPWRARRRDAGTRAGSRRRRMDADARRSPPIKAYIDFVKVKASGYPALPRSKGDRGLLGRTHVSRELERRQSSGRRARRLSFPPSEPRWRGASGPVLRVLNGDLGEIVAALDWETGGGVSAPNRSPKPTRGTPGRQSL